MGGKCDAYILWEGGWSGRRPGARARGSMAGAALYHALPMAAAPPWGNLEKTTGAMATRSIFGLACLCIGRGSWQT